MKLMVPLKAVVLAAGSKSISEDGQPVLLQEFGGKKVIDPELATFAQVVLPDETYIVVDYHGEVVRKHQGLNYLYETQAESKGSWVLLRFSGTKPVLRIFSEAKAPEKARGMADWLIQCAR